MQVTVTTLTSGKVFSLDIPEDLELENFKAFCEAESSIPASDIVIIYNGAPFCLQYAGKEINPEVYVLNFNKLLMNKIVELKVKNKFTQSLF